MAKQVFYETTCFYLLGGGEITLTYPETDTEDIMKDFLDALNSNEFWWVGNYGEANAMFNGKQIENINTRLIVGWR